MTTKTMMRAVIDTRKLRGSDMADMTVPINIDKEHGIASYDELSALLCYIYGLTVKVAASDKGHRPLK
jgi:hypothetical protein